MATVQPPAILANFGQVLGSASDTASDYAKFIIHGPQGAGKTTLASTIAEVGPTLFIDLVGEHGVRSFAGAPYERNITVLRPESVTQLDDLYWWLAAGDHPYKAVVIDSLTATQKLASRYTMGYDESAVREIRKGASPATFQTWGQSLDIMVDIATYWFGLADASREKPMHVVMTAQTKVVENEENGVISRTPDVQKGALQITLASCDYVLYCDMEENADALADETQEPMRHIVRFGPHPGYRTKGRVPVTMWGKIPPILGRKKPLSLASLSIMLGIGGMPSVKKRRSTTTAKQVANPTEAKES